MSRTPFYVANVLRIFHRISLVMKISTETKVFCSIFVEHQSIVQLSNLDFSVRCALGLKQLKTTTHSRNRWSYFRKCKQHVNALRDEINHFVQICLSSSFCVPKYQWKRLKIFWIKFFAARLLIDEKWIRKKTISNKNFIWIFAFQCNQGQSRIKKKLRFHFQSFSLMTTPSGERTKLSKLASSHSAWFLHIGKWERKKWNEIH